MADLPNLKGKKIILNAITRNPNLLRRMKEVNHCLIVGLGCTACHVPKLSQCWNKVTRELVREAFLKHRDKPEFKQEQEKLEKELKK